MSTETEEGVEADVPPMMRLGEMTEEETAACIEALIEREGEYVRTALPATNDLVVGSPAPDAEVLALDGTRISLLAHVGAILDAEPETNAVAVNFGSAT